MDRLGTKHERDSVGHVSGGVPLPYAAESSPRPPSHLQALIRFEGSPGRPCPNLMSAAADHPQPRAVYRREPAPQWHGTGPPTTIPRLNRWCENPFDRWCENPFSHPHRRESLPATCRWCENPFSHPHRRESLPATCRWCENPFSHPQKDRWCGNPFPQPAAGPESRRSAVRERILARASLRGAPSPLLYGRGSDRRCRTTVRPVDRRRGGRY